MWVCAEPPTASRRNGTVVLWVLTGTHRCDDSPKQGGEPSERQLVQCVVAWVRALWMSCKGTQKRDIRRKEEKKKTRKTVVGSGDLNITSLSKHKPSICARALREFISSELPRHQHDFTSTSSPLNCVREDISQSLVTHTEPFTSNTNSKSSCAMPHT